MSSLSYISSSNAILIDQELIKSFSMIQLIEIAGLSCALCIKNQYPINKNYRILVICGPDNGADGLVLARYLKIFGYKVALLYPKETDNEIYLSLLKQCELFDIKIFKEIPIDYENTDGDYHLEKVDAIFGFSFKGDIREPYKAIINSVKKFRYTVISIDVPSGWTIDSEDNNLWMPTMVISLTAPKICMKNYKGIHYIAGNFIPKSIEEKYNFKIPDYDYANGEIYYKCECD